MDLYFDRPWKIAALIALLALLRLAWWAWKQAPKRKAILETLDSALIAVILVFVVVRPFVVQAFVIPSRSMVPTIEVGDRILVNRFIYRLNPPQRGDIIVFDAPKYALLNPSEGQKDFIKRLIGLPGDKIIIRRGQGVFVNGELLQEAPGVPPPEYDWPRDAWGRTEQSYQVPKDCYFVLGDNRMESYDSHAWFDRETGQTHPELAKGRVLGKAMVRFWPPTRLGLLNDRAIVHIPSDLAPARGAAQAGSR
jgi:signal peptidase I